MQYSTMFAIAISIIAAFSVPTLAACADSAQAECRRSSECSGEQMCRLTSCVSRHRDAGAPDSTSNATSVTPTKDDDAEKPVRCTEGRSPRAGELAINEVLANVPTGPKGDASGDGERDAYGDEFIEFVNRSGEMLDLYDVGVAVDGTEVHAFAGRCLPPRHGMILFGGVPMADSGSDVQVVGIDGLGLSNSGGEITVLDPKDESIGSYTWADTRPVSHTLTPQIVGSNYAWHDELTDDGSLFSPGLRADGTSLSSGR